uniref:tRNA (guanine(37)-N1)-methyltransferase n=1 Tax=Kwoniella bestiolae CBS 10118 TaxID=1296100 RepID=A0A1B9FUF8_9TREE|nr:tRNA (guanine37-N1)-methyltransferase [Kwoniella bestiolae CBS 10118]OCF22405.1 tRNA (guanine37-N1)-methyltransferase [Kwoniella bestiolae CBS 10118]
MSVPSSSSSSQLHGALAEYMRPPQHIGMQTLDRQAFQRDVPVVSVAVEASKVGKVRSNPALRGLVLELPKVKPIVESQSGEEGIKWIRLHVSKEEDIPSEVKQVIESETSGTRRENVHLGYDNWNTSEILSAVLPTTKSDDIPSSFTSTGHIAHMNLREEWLPYRYLIGQVILDKNPGLRTVVNKLDTIHAQYRYFDMEVIAGDKDYITTLNESNCTFTFNFSLVYWNSRLHHEHERLIDLFKPNSLVADVMAGVGPFAVPAAKRGSYVLGNDLNPESVKWMRENRVKNHVENNLRIFEQDGNEFIQTIALEAWLNPFQASAPPPSKRQQREQRKKREAALELKKAQEEKPISTAILNTGNEEEKLPEPPRIIQHFIMNLPDSALTFLHSYNGCFTPLLREQEFTEKYGKNGEGLKDGELPMVHVYCFTKEMELDKAQEDVLKRASDDLSYPLTTSTKDYHLHHVRSVAPNKDMYCLSFRLPREVAFKAL